MAFLCVGTLFRNESHSICEWIEHYKHQGVDHLYLLDDASDDDSLQKIQPYIDEGFVSCETIHEPRYLGRQRNLYNRHFLPRIRAKEMKWFLVCDMDEYVWTPAYSNLAELFRNIHHSAQIQVNHTVFGSNGHETQPPSVVAGFTRRAKDQPSEEKLNYKYFVNSEYEFSSLNVHHATFADDSPKFKESPLFMMLGPQWLIMNHYKCQSREFWQTVKCTRGDADHYLQRNDVDFMEADCNDVEDTRLFDLHTRLHEESRSREES